MTRGRCLTLVSIGFGLLASVSYWANPSTVESCEMRPQVLLTDCDARSAVDEAVSSADVRKAVAEPGRVMPWSGNRAFVRVVGEPVAEPRENGPAGGAGDAKAPEQTDSADEAAAAIAAALAGALSGTGSNAAERTAPMTRAERDAFRLAAQDCWMVDPGSPAGRTAVTVGFDLDEEGEIVGEVQLLMHDAPSQEIAGQAFEAARRAILSCQDHVVPLPPEEYNHERRAEITFDARTWTIR